MFEKLEKKYELYSALLPSVQDKWGFIDTVKCDSTLFSGLLGCVPGTKVVLEAAEKSSGQWLRRPCNYVECWVTGGSRSTISRDMLLGVMWFATINRDRNMIVRLWKYAWRHCWRMGKGRFFGADTFMNPAMMGTLAQICLYLGHRTIWTSLWAGLPHMPGKATGYSRHLQTLLILLRKRVGSELCFQERQALDRNYEEQPTNPLYAYAAGKTTEATWLLENLPYYPKDRLPTDGDIKEAWPIQRDTEDSSMERGDRATLSHSGGDFLFVASLILGKF